MPDNPITILLPRNIPGDIAAEIRALSPRIALITAEEVAARPELIEQVEVSFGGILADAWPRAVRLRWVQTQGAGVERLLELAADSQVVITNVHIHAQPIAEHLFGMLLMLTRRLDAAYRQQLVRHWGGVGAPQVLTGKTLGVLGTGAIGRRAGEIGAAFGMRVLGMRRSCGELPPFEEIFTPTQKMEMLPRCDILMLALPLTPETHHFIGATEFAQMKPGAMIFNIGRGKLIDTDAMLAGLCNGRLAGAGLDVTDPEPLPPDHPLWTLPNVLITPHYAGAYPDYMQDAARVFLDNLRRYLTKESLMNVVGRERGY